MSALLRPKFSSHILPYLGERPCALFCHRYLPPHYLRLLNLLLLLLLLQKVFVNKQLEFCFHKLLTVFDLICWRNIISGVRKNQNCRDDAQMMTYQKVNYRQFLCSDNVEIQTFFCEPFLLKHRK